LPAERSKTRVEFRIPLTPQALAILEAIRAVQGSPYVFARTVDDTRALSHMIFQQTLARVKIASTPHGFRTSLVMWGVEEGGYTGELMQRCLNHQVGSAVTCEMPARPSPRSIGCRVSVARKPDPTTPARMAQRLQLPELFVG
jgi:integrase